MLRSNRLHFALHILPGLLVLLWTAPFNAAFAQSRFERNLVFDQLELQRRNLPKELKNKGLVFKGFNYKPRLSFETGYNSNVLAQTSDTTWDFYHAIRPGISVQKNYGPHEFRFSANFNLERYHSRENENKEEFFFETRGRFVANSRWQFPFDVIFRRDTLSRTQPRERNISRTPTSRRFFEGELGIKRDFNHLSLTLLGHYRDQELDDGRAINTGQPVIKSDANRNEYGATVRARYLLGGRNKKPEYNFFTTLTWNEQDFDKRRFQNGSFNGRTNDRSEQIATLGFETRYKDLIYANLGAGLTRQNFEAPGIETVNELRFQGDLRASVTKKLDLKLNGARAVNQESELTSGSVNTRFGVGLDYEFHHDTYFESGLDYIDSDFIDQQRQDEDIILRGSLKHYLNDNLTSELSLKYRDRTSNLSGNAFQRTLLLLSITGRL